MDGIEVDIYIGGKVRHWPMRRYVGGKKITCKNKDPDFMSWIELKRAIRYLGFRNLSEVFMTYRDVGFDTMTYVSNDADLLHVIGKLNGREALVIVVTHRLEEYDDPECDGFNENYFIGDKPNSWKETKIPDDAHSYDDIGNLYDVDDAGSFGIPSDIGSDVSDLEYFPSDSSSDDSNLEDIYDVAEEPNLTRLNMVVPNTNVENYIDDPNIGNDSDHLYSPCVSDDDDGKFRQKCRYWNSMTDYERPIILEVGLVFPDRDEFKRCLFECSIQQGFSYKFMCNERHRVVAWCSQNCGWKIRVSDCKITNGFRIKTLTGEHTCPRVHKNSRVKSSWLATKILQMVKADVDWKVERIRNHVKEKFHLEMSRQQCYRAKKKALSIIQGEEREQYARLRDYCNALMAWNPGSSAYIYSPNYIFTRMYVCLDACKRGFVEACRPLIAVDGCHLKTAFGGQLLCAIGKDPDDNMYPIAFAVVEIENGESWAWFLELLMNGLGVHQNKHWTFISDQQKGLVGALKGHVDSSHHRFCLRHLYANFKARFRGKVLKDLLWKAAISTTDRGFKNAMDEIKQLDPDAHKWLNEKDTTQWAKHKFDTECKSDLIMNNVAETFNAWILDARTKPIRTMCEQIRRQLMNRFVAKSHSLDEYGGKICPRIQAKLNRNKNLSHEYGLHFDGHSVYEVVSSSDSRFLVKLGSRTCTCRRWDLTGIPCAHAVATILHERGKPEDYVDSYYYVETFKRAYNHIIHAMPGSDEWRCGLEPDLEPPVALSQPGRKKKVRRRDPDEIQTAFKLKRGGVAKTCGSCGGTDHNTRSCTTSITNPARAAKARKEADRVQRYRDRKKDANSQPPRPVRACRKRNGGSSSSQPTPRRSVTTETTTPSSSSQPAPQRMLKSKLPIRKKAQNTSLMENE